jgi:hypothetical protein
MSRGSLAMIDDVNRRSQENQAHSLGAWLDESKPRSLGRHAIEQIVIMAASQTKAPELVHGVGPRFVRFRTVGPPEVD